MQNIGHSIHFLKQIGSTNSHIIDDLTPTEKIHGTVVYTYHQTAGRGQRRNVWESEPYKNIALSVFLAHDLPAPDDQFVLNVITGLAVRKVVDKYAPSGVYVKWPNDIISERQKLAGILIESTLQGDRIIESVVGVGLNVNQTNFGDLSEASSLKSIMQSRSDLVLDLIRDELISELNSYWNDYIHGDVASLWTQYENCLYREGSIIDIYGNTLNPNELISVNGNGSISFGSNDEKDRYIHGQIRWDL